MSFGFTVSAEYISNGTITDSYVSLPVFVGICGVGVTLITFFGCCGAIKESKVMTGIYVALLIIMMICTFIAGIVGYVYRGKVDGYVKEMLTESMKHWCSTSQGLWEFSQENFKCCGVEGPQDWVATSEAFKYWSKGYYELEMNPANQSFAENPVPASCCIEKSGEKGCGLLDGADIYKPGCLTKIEHNLDENLTKIAGAAVGISVFSLIVIGVSWYLAKQYAKKTNLHKEML